MKVQNEQDILKDRIAFCRQVIEQLLREEYRMKMEVPVRVNPYLKTTQGRVYLFHHRDTGRLILTKTIIEFNKRVLLTASKEHIRGVARHEAVHYGLLMQGKPYKDGSATFERETHRLGIPSNFGEFSEEDKEQYKRVVQKSLWYFCECEKCGKLAKLWKKTPPNGSVEKMKKYRTSCCRANLVYKGGDNANTVLEMVLNQQGR